MWWIQLTELEDEDVVQEESVLVYIFSGSIAVILAAEMFSTFLATA